MEHLLAVHEYDLVAAYNTARTKGEPRMPQVTTYGWEFSP